jgi:hypothetical protein
MERSLKMEDVERAVKQQAQGPGKPSLSQLELAGDARCKSDLQQS